MTKRRYRRNFCVGLRIEVPNKYLNNKDLSAVFKKDPGLRLVDLCRGGKVVPRQFKGLILAKNEGEGGNVSSFGLLINFGEDLEKVRRVIKIMNILGDDKLFKERVKSFVLGKSVLNALPELVGLKQALLRLEQLIPRFTDVAWFSAPDAKLR